MSLWDCFDLDGGVFLALSWPRGEWVCEYDGVTFLVRADCESDAADTVVDWLGKEGEYWIDGDGVERDESDRVSVRRPTPEEYGAFEACLSVYARWEHSEISDSERDTLLSKVVVP